MNKAIKSVAGGAALVIALLVVAWFTSAVSPVVWQPTINPGLSGVFAPNTQLNNLQKQLAGQLNGPEDVTLGPDGLFYTGNQDGTIVRFALGDEKPELYINSTGRPLGLQFDATGNLIVADAFLGLVAYDTNQEMTVLASHYQGEKMVFVDDLDIAADGTIWFSDASQRFDQHHFIYDFIEARSTGRLFAYNPATDTLTLKMDGLFFANGVALGPDDNYVLVNETGTGKIHRLWLKGDKAGQQDVFYDGLPAGPDNLSFNGIDTFWVALPVLRQAITDGLADQTWLRRLLGALPVALLEASVTYHSHLVGIDLNGNITHNLQGDPQHFHSITSVNQVDGNLVIGSLTMDAVGVYPLPGSQPHSTAED